MGVFSGWLQSHSEMHCKEEMMRLIKTKKRNVWDQAQRDQTRALEFDLAAGAPEFPDQAFRNLILRHGPENGAKAYQNTTSAGDNCIVMSATMKWLAVWT